MISAVLRRLEKHKKSKAYERERERERVLGDGNNYNQTDIRTRYVCIYVYRETNKLNFHIKGTERALLQTKILQD